MTVVTMTVMTPLAPPGGIGTLPSQLLQLLKISKLSILPILSLREVIAGGPGGLDTLVFTILALAGNLSSKPPLPATCFLLLLGV